MGRGHKSCVVRVDYIRSALHEGSRPLSSKANSHEILTQAKKEGGLDMPQGSTLSYHSGPTQFFPSCRARIYVFSALKYNFISFEYEFQGMALAPSCSLGIDLLD